MTRTRYSVVPPDSLVDIFRPLAGVSDENFQKFIDSVRSNKGFSTDKKRCEQLGELIGLSAEDTAVLLSFTGGLYQRFRSLEKSGANFDTLVEAFVEEALQNNNVEADTDKLTQGQFLDGLSSRLKLLLSQNDKIDTSDKIARLKQGFIKNATGFGTFVDLRADFREKFTSINSLVPIVQLRILTDADDVSSREFVCQFDARALTRLKEVIAEAEDKLRTISSHAVLSHLILMDDTE